MFAARLWIAAAAALVAFPPTAQAQSVEARAPITPYKPAFAGQTRAPEQKLGVAFEAATIATGLRFPWAIAFLPDGRLLVTERMAGALRLVGPDGSLSEPLAGAPAVFGRGQGGLLDVILDPAFARTRLVYLSYAEAQPDGTNNTAVARPPDRGPGAAARGLDGDLSPAAVAEFAAAFRLAPGVRPRRQALRHARRPLPARRPEAVP